MSVTKAWASPTHGELYLLASPGRGDVVEQHDPGSAFWRGLADPKPA